MRRFVALTEVLPGCGLWTEKDPVLPFVDNVRVRFEPRSDATWVTPASTTFAVRITATDMIPDGKYLAIGGGNAFRSATNW